MNIAVINIRDLAKYLIILVVLITIVIVGIKIVIGNEELEDKTISSEFNNSSFLYCLGLELPIMENEENENRKKDETLYTHQILNSELEMLCNIEAKDNIEKEEHQEIVEGTEDNQESDKTINVAENVQTTVISENNIEASFTNSSDSIKVKNQSEYDITELIKDSNYQLKNKEKVVIYHTHTCESYTSSEKYSYEMTGAYRTTDLSYTVARVRR